MRAYDLKRNERPRATPFDTVPMAIASGLLLASFVVAAVACFTGIRYRGVDPIWPPAARLFYFSGVVLLIHGIWCAVSLDAARRVWGASGRGVGMFIATVGIAMIGGAIEYDDRSSPWLLSLVPFGVSVIAAGVALCRRPSTDRHESPPWIFLLAFIVIGGVAFAIAYADVTG